MSEAYLELSGTRLLARENGTGGLVILLHGFPEHGAVWCRQEASLSADYHVVALDSRGHGRSDCPPDPELYRIERLVADIIQLADHFGDDRFVLAGHDWGGIVAWFTAAMHPDRVSRLVIVNAPHPTLFQRSLDQDPDQRQASAYIAALTSPDAKQLTANRLWAATLNSAYEQGLVLPSERTALLNSWGRPGAIQAMLNWYRSAPFDFNSLGGQGGGRWPEDLLVLVPTLVIWGMDDPLLRPSLLDDLQGLVPDLEIEKMYGVGHSPLRERPDAVTAIMTDFLARRPDQFKGKAITAEQPTDAAPLG